MKTNRIAMIAAAALLGAASLLPVVTAEAETTRVVTPQERRDARIDPGPQLQRVNPQPNMNQVRGVPQRQNYQQTQPSQYQQPVDRAPAKGPNPGK